MNNIWAIDIDPQNVEMCRSRVLSTVIKFLENHEKTPPSLIFKKNKEFIAHLLCCIKWQIHENEALSALAEPEKAINRANLTQLGMNWIVKNKQRQVDFDLSWCEYFCACKKLKTTPVEFQRSLNFIASQDKTKKFGDFSFAFEVLSSTPFFVKTKSRIRG
jgi:hypothetical protein